LRYFKVIANLALVVAVTMGGVASVSASSLELDGSAHPSVGEPASPDPGEAALAGDHVKECGHHTLYSDCPSCPACAILPTGGVATTVVDADQAASEYRSHLEQGAPRRELPPPKRA